MKTEVRNIPFEDGELLGVRTEDGKVWLGVRKACIDIGLSEDQAKAETKKIQSSLLLSNHCKKLRVKFDPQVREILVLSEKMVPMWLAQINLTPAMQKKNLGAVRKLLSYQTNAADVLHKAFYETEEQKETFHESLGLEGEFCELKGEVKNLNSTVLELKDNLNILIESSTINTRQQQKLYATAKDRINHLLGGAHSKSYKDNGKSYFINLWNDLKEQYECGSYKDLNPMYFSEALDFVSKWCYE